MTKPSSQRVPSERELLESQIQRYEFYAGLIDRAVGGGTQPKLPKWDEQRAQEYQRLADELRVRLAELTAREASAPATQPGTGTVKPSPESGGGDEAIAPE